MADAGWKIPFASAILGYTPDAGSSAGGEEGKSLLSRLTGLFGIEAVWHDGPLILEQDEPEKPKKEPDFKKAMKQYLDETGLTQQFEKDAKELLEVQEEFVQTILDEAVPRLSLISVLTQTSDVDEFVEAIDAAQREGVDLKAAGLDKVKQGVEDASKKLIESDEFKGQTAERANKTVEELTDKELETAAKNVAFVNSKQEFDKQAMQGKETLKISALEELAGNTPGEKNMSAMRSTPIGQTFIKLIEDAKQKIQNA